MELITKSFADQCLAFPSRVDRALATVTTVQDAKDLLDKASVMAQYAERLKAGVAIERPIAFGVLKIKAKLGELLPAKTPKETGAMKGKGIWSDQIPFHPCTIVAYRKIAANKDKLETYYETTEDVPTQTDFIKSVTVEQRAAKEAERERKRDINRKKVSKVKHVSETTATFSTIVIDPPWDWGDENDCDQMGRSRPDYATMTIDQLKALPVGKLSDEHCHIYMWITNRSLPKGFSLLEAWGFRYVTCLTWPKASFGLGNYFRGQTEQVLFGVRGSMLLKRKDASTLLEPWKRGGKHSAKPVEFYGFVESCSPGPYLEMFSRTERNDWTSWGEGS